MKPKPHLVAVNNGIEPSTEAVLRGALIGRDEAMRTVREFDAVIAGELKALAKERGVLFLRQEAVRQELLG